MQFIILKLEEREAPILLQIKHFDINDLRRAIEGYFGETTGIIELEETIPPTGPVYHKIHFEMNENGEGWEDIEGIVYRVFNIHLKKVFVFTCEQGDFFCGMANMEAQNEEEARKKLQEEFNLTMVESNALDPDEWPLKNVYTVVIDDGEDHSWWERFAETQ